LVWLQGRPRVPFAAISLGHGTPTFGKASFGLVLRRRNERSHLSSDRYITGPFQSAGNPLGRPRSAGWEESGRKSLRRHPVDGPARWSRASARRSTGPCFGKGQGKATRAGGNPRLRAKAETSAPRDRKPAPSGTDGRERNPCGRKTAPSGAGKNPRKPVLERTQVFGSGKEPAQSANGNPRPWTRAEESATRISRTSTPLCGRKPAPSGTCERPHNPVQLETRVFGQRRKAAHQCRRNLASSDKRGSRHDRDGGDQDLRELEETNATVRSETRVFGQRRKRAHRAGENPRLRARAETHAKRAGGHQHLRELKETHATVLERTQVFGSGKEPAHRANGNPRLRARAEGSAPC
jgi:hypothetical protein